MKPLFLHVGNHGLVIEKGVESKNLDLKKILPTNLKFYLSRKGKGFHLGM